MPIALFGTRHRAQNQHPSTAAEEASPTEASHNSVQAAPAVDRGTGKEDAAHDDARFDSMDPILKNEESASPMLQKDSQQPPQAAAVQPIEINYRELLENSTTGIFTMAADGQFVQVNLAAARILGYESPEQFLSHPPQRFNNFYVESDRGEDYMRLMKENGEVREFESRVRCLDESVIWVEENIRLVPGSKSTPLRYEGTIQDITRRKDREAQLLRHAFHDKLTGLPDRTLFLERANRCMKRRQRRPSYWFAVLFLDLDRFKIVNDSLGHVIGDQLLISTARKLESCLRPGDTVARLGGDEFGILLDDIRDVSDATHVAERILQQLATPAILDGHEIYTTSSIGIALVSNSYERPEDLLRDADVAMYRAKALGKARFAIFDSAMHADGKNLLQLEADLRHAITNHEFRVEYQPVINLASGRIEGFEAFLRWNHPQRGLVPPSQFVPVAEETGLLVGLDRWVLGEACRQMYTWQKQFPMQSLLTMSVNLSARQFSQSDLVEEIDRIVRRSSLSPRCLRLELTERSLLANPDSTEAALLELKKQGIQLSLDDFGTGYSSLSHLHRFSFDALKVDQSFISQMDNVKNDEVVRAIITIAHNLNMNVIAEGVETAEQLTRLRALDCHYGQGYLFSGPLEASAVRDLMASKPQW
jgi:diguanylate cyclase (GGDEF)-like protein/PAS domain S-box-containing protein